MNQNIVPTPLKKGDKIGIISPAGSVKIQDLEPTLRLIGKKGFQPVLSENCLKNFDFGYSYSGSIDERLQDLNWALNDENIRAIWASRGGYGSQHLLQMIDLKGFIENPKWYIGYSDNTAIQAFLLRNFFCSIHGQTIKKASFGVNPQAYEKIFHILEGGDLFYENFELFCSDTQGIDKIEGELIGGNLALIYALLGTEFSFDFRDKILFIEDIGEHFYSVDRMLTSFELAGVFKQIKGLIVGGMTQMGEEQKNPNFSESYDEVVYKIIIERLKKYHFPIIFNFPNGHIYDNFPLILGQNIEIVFSENEKIKIYQKKYN